MSIYIHDMEMPKGKPICIIIDTIGQVRRYDLNNDKYADDELFEAIPAADVRPVVLGKWIEHNYDPEYLSCDFSCSECNVYLEEYYFGEGQWPGKTDHYFCPNCGARMEES